ncbi:MAG: hypothetical protein V2I24_06855, partial [Halieaceae bacterium]|nr:hypothetical protein [Halieaceae bacterium]
MATADVLAPDAPPVHRPAAGRLSWLRRSALAWFAMAAVGQLAFVYFIVAYYGTRTAAGNYAGWDDKPLI